MSELILHRDAPQNHAIVLPEPRTPISIRHAVPGAADVKFIDELQRRHSRMVGWFPTKQLETNIGKGHVLIAESGADRVGYVIAHDRYFKRDDCGIVYQLNVAPGKQRGLIGASLIKAVFDRMPYGVKLFCCWCAQDLEANHFWESIGFVPLAFRAGSRSAGRRTTGGTPVPRMHIFWQRRIREGDTETPYWFPAETSGGAVRENRLVLPIPPGMHWSDAKPSVLPGAVLPGIPGVEHVNAAPQIEGEVVKKPREKKPKPLVVRPKRGLWFAPPAPPPTPEELKAAKSAKPKPKPVRMKNDPKLVAAAREFRDRYLDEVNAGRMLPSANGKYDVSRLPHPELEPGLSTVHHARLLDAA